MAAYLRDIEPRFARSDVYAQLLRLRLLVECAGGAPVECGWLKDKFGLSWQIVPTALPELLSGPDPEKSQRVMKVMLTMKKLDIRALKQAYEKP